jgi:hypothetical protein
MIDNLDNIDKVIKILSKTISKKYPYLSNIQIEKIIDDAGTIQIDIDLDLNRFLEYNKLKLRPSLDELMKKYSDDTEYLKSLFRNPLYLNTYLSDVEEVNDNFGYKKNEEIESYLKDMMYMLPPHLSPTHKFQSSFDERIVTDYPVDFRIDSYNIKFDPERYLEVMDHID